MKKKKKIPPIAEATIGARCNCSRCKRECRVASDRTEEARMLRKSKTPDGYCVNCAVTDWLAHTYPVNQIIEEAQLGPALLLIEQIQRQFFTIMAAGGSNARPEEIDWEWIVQYWDLPLEVKTTAENPHLPGDSMRRALAKKEVRIEDAEDQSGRIN